MCRESWDIYKFHEIRFEYVPATSTSSEGEVALAFEPDPLDDQPGNYVEVMTYEYSASSVPWMNFGIRVPSSYFRQDTRALYIDHGEALADRFYDSGRLIVATQGQADTSNIGAIYVHYTIELKQPQRS